ncbi:MAG: DUF1624 domain-containing protein [Oscillospiraceae bacterium]|nr:DUF1624 domain-containing protein [Oscillospiraceae bacterium]
MKQRIWELDAFRGVCILGMVIVHLIYDAVELYGLVDWRYPTVFLWLRDWGGVLFLVLSGICVTLGSRSVRRGITVFSAGMLCTAVTAGMYFLDMADRSILIYFGVLHCLGVCMLLWQPMKKLPLWALALIAAVLIGVGLYWWGRVFVPFDWLFPLGLTSRSFLTSDYYPLLPNLGFFLVGTMLGQTVYRKRQTLLPRVNTQHPLIAFLCFCGRNSLVIYLAHQPVLSGLLWTVSILF